jgi:hypothetical protein
MAQLRSSDLFTTSSSSSASSGALFGTFTATETTFAFGSNAKPALPLNNINVNNNNNVPWSGFGRAEAPIHEDVVAVGIKESKFSNKRSKLRQRLRKLFNRIIIYRLLLFVKKSLNLNISVIRNIC